MATILNDAAYMALPMNIKRGNPIPLDTTAVWYDKTELETYAASGATAYVGQILTLYADSKCEAYMISNEAGTLIKLASTTASGDLASDVATLQGQVTDLVSKVGKAAEGEKAATGLYALIEEVKTLANTKVASVTAADKSVTIGGSATAPTVKVALATGTDNALTLVDDGLKVVIPEVTVPEYDLIKKTDSGDYAAVYQLTKDGTAIGADINIPKDMMVKSGSVHTYETGSLPEGITEPGTYIVLVLNDTAGTELYINVNGLIEYVTSGSAEGDMVFINIDPKTHKVTASITDGTITETKLAKAVTDKLAKAVSAVQTITIGSANGNISVDGKDVAVKGLGSAAYTESSAYDAAGAANTVKTTLIGGADDNDAADTIRGAKAYAKAMSESAKADAVNDAKTYTNTELSKLSLEDTAEAKKLVSAVTQENGKIAVTRRVLVADDIPELAQSKISGLPAALAAKQDTVSFDGEYSASNKAATVKTVTDAVAAIVSNGEDKAADDTIKGAKLYADSKSSDALTAAKAYADGLVTGDSGVTARVEALEGKVDVTKVSTAISMAKTEAINAAKEDAATKDAALKTAILGEEAYAQTVKSAYELAASKATITDIENKGYATKTEAQAMADGKDAAIKDAKKAGTDAMAKIGTIPEGATATTAIDYVDEKIAAIPAQVDYTVSVEESTPAGVAKRYTLSQKGNQLVTIDIPKDMVVSSGTVETKTTTGAWGEAGTYLVLTLANATNDKVYINVGDLIEYVTGAAASDGIITTSVDANHVLTATIGDGKITKAKLATAIQTSLGKADTALQAAALEPYAKTADVEAGYVAKNGTDRLMTADEGTKLAGISNGAQANVLEIVKVGGTALTIEDKAVDITGISTDLLKNGTNALVLNCGGAADLT